MLSSVDVVLQALFFKTSSRQQENLGEMSSGVKLLMLSLAFVVGIANGDDLSSDEEGQVPLLDQGIQLFHDVTQFATRQADLFSGNFVEEVVDRIHDTDHGVRICNEQEEFSNGVCHTQFKCNTFGGERVGFCPIITPKTTCCKFEKTCGGESDHTVAYFNSPRPNADEIPCEFKIKSRLGACQVSVNSCSNIDPKREKKKMRTCMLAKLPWVCYF